MTARTGEAVEGVPLLAAEGDLEIPIPDHPRACSGTAAGAPSGRPRSDRGP